MWLFHPLGFASIVADTQNPDNLLARGRVKRDLEQLFPAQRRRITADATRDYRFRVSVPRPVVAARLAELATTIDYTNFKNAAPADRHDAYLQVWTAMYRLQLPRRRALARRRGKETTNFDVYDDVYCWPEETWALTR